MIQLRLKGIFALFLASISCSLALTANVEAKNVVQDKFSNNAPQLPEAAQRRNETIEIISASGVLSNEVDVYVAGASFIKLHFNKFKLPRDIVVEVRSPDGNEVYRYSSTHKDALTVDRKQGDNGVTSFSAMSINGDTAVVRVLGNGHLLNSVMHRVNIDYFMEGLPEEFNDYEPYNPEPKSHIQSSGGKSISQPQSMCGTEDRNDAVCWAGSHPTEFDRSRPVAKLLINGSQLCTAWRVGSGNHLLTNRHCLPDQFTTSTTEVWFNYQTTECGGSELESGLTKVAADIMLKNSNILDYTLFTVNEFSAISNFGYLGLDIQDGAVGTEIYIPQHGGGVPKQMGMVSDMNAGGYCEIDAINLYGYAAGTDVGYFCDTSGGSSGAPVLAADTHEVIALHHFGGCLNQGVSISKIWPEIAGFFGNVVPAGDDVDSPINTPPEPQFSFACTGLHCDFNASSSFDTDGTITSYSWSLGDGDTAGGMNISHDYPNGGSFSIVLTVQDNDGANNQAANTLTLAAPNANPVAVFLVACNQGSCNFDASASFDSDGAISSYTWDFGDGTSNETAGSFFTHEYSASGSYLVRLTLRDNLAATGTAESSVGVVIDQVVNLNPNAEFTFECQNLSCTFNGTASTDPDGSISGYNWSFGDGNEGVGEIAAHSFSAEGIYQVTLYVSDNVEASDFQVKQVEVVAAANIFNLTGTIRKSRNVDSARLLWSGAFSGWVDIFRDGSFLTNTINDGVHTDIDLPGNGKPLKYQVCEAGMSVCSNEFTVKP